jgi:REP element-mobilizing transposase RayT
MVAAYHLIWTAYGYWLPTDPRGSTSHELHCAQLAPLGELHHGRKRIQPAGRVIRDFYDAARGLLKYELKTFTPSDVSTIACGFAETIKKRTYTCYACAIMPNHVHLVIRKHRDQAETMIENLQVVRRAALQNESWSEHPVWGGPGWKVYLDTREEITRTIGYVEQNPVKLRKPVQVWPFVARYDGWLPGVGAKPQADGERYGQC